MSSNKCDSEKAEKRLMSELQSIVVQPVRGFRLDPYEDNESNIFMWNFLMFGEPGTFYEGGCFKLGIEFPPTYPFSPPSLRFMHGFWHPNVYHVSKNFEVCLSILTTDAKKKGMDEQGGWTPAHSIRAILQSLLLVIANPNVDSPANVDAANEYQRRLTDQDYFNNVRQTVEESKRRAWIDRICVPTNEEEYSDPHFPFLITDSRSSWNKSRRGGTNKESSSDSDKEEEDLLHLSSSYESSPEKN